MIASSATAGQPRSPSRGALALVHLGVLGQPRLLGVLGDDAVERLDVLQRPAHQHGVGHAVPVVGEDPHPGGRVGHRAELGQLLAGEPDRHRADRRDVDQPASRPSRQTCSTTPAVSATGSVLAIAWTAVKPPRAAARVPDSTVSASSRPGSRRWVCRSTRPGSATRPSASRTVAPERVRPDADLGDHAVAEQQIGRLAAQDAGALHDVHRLVRHGATTSPSMPGCSPDSSR